MTEPTSPAPKHTHYVSRENNCIYQALSSPAGYEDGHPEEYRPATSAEIEKFLSGVESVVAKPLPLDASVGAAVATPTSIKLSEDDAPPVTIVPPADAAKTAVPPAPAFSTSANPNG